MSKITQTSDWDEKVFQLLSPDKFLILGFINRLIKRIKRQYPQTNTNFNIFYNIKFCIFTIIHLTKNLHYEI